MEWVKPESTEAERALAHRPVRVAFVSQPIDYTGPRVQGSSIALWTDRAMRSLHGPGVRFRVYAKHFPDQPATETVDEIEFRRFSTRLDELAAKPFKLAERALGFPFRKRPFFASSLSYAAYAWQIAADLRRAPVDIVHIHNFSQLVGPIRRLNPAVKIVLHMHCEWLTQLDPALIDRRLRQVDLIAGCSQYITEQVRQRFPQHAARCQAIYNGVDTDLFSPDETNPPAENHAPRVLFVGRISPEKGLHVLVEAFRQVAAACPQAHLDLVGAPGNAPYEYMSLVSDDPHVRALSRYYHGMQKRGDYDGALKAGLPAELAGRVTFHGPLPHAVLAQRYRSSALLVNPSLSEAFGMSLIEGMACGLPVVAARVGGMVEIVRPGETGLLVEPDDPSALAGAILRLLNDDPLRARMGAAGQQVARQAYGWAQIAGCLREAYQSLEEPHARR